MMSGNMFFDKWFTNLSEEEQTLHEEDCHKCGYKMDAQNTSVNENGESTTMCCESCGYTEIWYKFKKEITEVSKIRN